MGVGRSKLSSENYLFVLAAEFVAAELSAGGEDISSCELHPTSRTETAAIKNINFFIVFLTSRSRCLSEATSGATLGRKATELQSFIHLKGL